MWISKHPVAGAFAMAVVASLASAALVMGIYPAQQAPWALALIVIAFPFIWFMLWIVVNAIAWWRGITQGPAETLPDERDRT